VRLTTVIVATEAATPDGAPCMIKAWDVFVIPKAAVMGSPSRKSVAVGHRSVPK